MVFIEPMNCSSNGLSIKVVNVYLFSVSSVSFLWSIEETSSLPFSSDVGNSTCTRLTISLCYTIYNIHPLYGPSGLRDSSAHVPMGSLIVLPGQCILP